MNWKEAPHLFANGKFFFDYGKEIDKLYNFRIEGFRHELKDRFKGMDIGCYHLSSGQLHPIHENNKLIARPLSDLNEDEKAKWKHFIYDKDAPKSMISRYANQTAWLLSIGVYPFDENNAKNVIWRYENDQTHRIQTMG